ncbi:MAG: recombinase family protein [Gaiellaceae bacterium]
MRVVAYYRVSTSEQARHGLSLETQRDAVRRYVTARGWVLVGEYLDEGVSAYTGVRRPQFERMLADIPELRAERVVVTAIDRLGRNMREGIEVACRLTDDEGVHVVALNGVDTSAPGGRHALFLALMIADQESAHTSARVKANYPAMLRKHGRKPGGRRKYGRNPDGSIVAAEADVIRTLLVPWCLAGVSELEAARRLNESGIRSARGGQWHGATVAKALRRPDLANILKIEHELVEAPLGSLTPIIDRELWARVQEVFARRTSGPETRGRGPRVPRLIGSPIEATCGHCGEPMRFRTGKQRADGSVQASYVCQTRISERGRVCLDPVPREKAEAVLLAVFTSSLIDEQATLREIKRARQTVVSGTRATLNAAEREVLRLEAEAKTVKRRFRADEITAKEWRSELAEIADDRRAAEAEVERLRSRVEEVAGADALHAAQATLVAHLADIRQLARELPFSGRDDADLVAAVRDAISRVVEEVVFVDADLPVNVNCLGAIRLAAGSGREVGDEVRALLKLHPLEHRRMAVELVPRHDLAVASTVIVNGEDYRKLMPTKTVLSLADNAAFTSQKTSRRPRRRIRSSSLPPAQTFAPSTR